MSRVPRVSSFSRFLSISAIVVALLAVTLAARAQAPTSQPVAEAVAAPTPSPDPIGFNGGPTAPLLNPNPYLSGWTSGAADKNLDAPSGGTWKAWAGEKPTGEELAQHTSKLYYSMNMTWVLIAGFL